MFQVIALLQLSDCLAMKIKSETEEDFKSLRRVRKTSARLENMGFRRAGVDLLRALEAGSCRISREENGA